MSSWGPGFVKQAARKTAEGRGPQEGEAASAPYPPLARPTLGPLSSPVRWLLPAPCTVDMAGFSEMPLGGRREPEGGSQEESAYAPAEGGQGPS